MLRTNRAMFLASVLLAAFGSLSHADEASTKRELTRLVQLTGTDPRKGALQEILANEESAKQLLSYALPLAKDEKKEALSYNGAFLLGLAAVELKDMPAAEAFLKVCAKRAAKLQSVDKLLESYVGLFELYYEKKRYDDAARICDDLLNLKTGDGKPHLVYRAYTNRNGEVDFLEDDHFDSVARLRPTVQQLLVQTIAKQGKFDQALTLVDSLIKQRDDWQDRQLKAWVLREAGRLEGAAAVYEDVISRVDKDRDLEPEKRAKYAARYRYELSNLYVDMNKIDKASEILGTLIKSEPRKAGYYNDLGYIWADHDMKLDEAEKLIRKALELDRKERRADSDFDATTDRDNGAYLDSLGWVLFKQKKLQAAKETLQRAVADKNSQHIEIYDHLGDVNLALGDRPAAVAAWREGLKHVGEGRREQERRAAVEKKLKMNEAASR
jgi:tetratricopeptide (TPR) repeat protein